MDKKLIIFGANGALGKGVTKTLLSKDFDEIYEHDRTDELTFGSRPPTAPEKIDKPDPMSPFTPGTEFADNSMVLIGQTTADRKNALIGNQF